MWDVWFRVSDWWADLSRPERWIAAGGPTLFLLAILALIFFGIGA